MHEETEARDDETAVTDDVSRRVFRTIFSAQVGFSLATLAFLAYFAFMALDFGSEARRAPLTVGVPATFVGLILVASEARKRWRALAPRHDFSGPDVRAEEQSPEVAGTREAEPLPEDSATESRGADDSASGDDEPREQKLTTVAALAWVMLSALIFTLFGLYVTAITFTLVFAKVYGKEPWWIALVSAAGSYLVFWLFFAELLGVSVYSGMLL